jgi:uncharacterized protein (TIGR03083 family)
MTLPRDVTVAGMENEYRAFAELIGGLSSAEWHEASRCTGWRVADVAGHVVGQLTDVVNFRLDGLGSAETTQRQADERRRRSPSELAEELLASTKVAADLGAGFDDAAWAGPLPGGGAGTLGGGVEALWFDTYVHADDIRAALGRPTEPGEGIRASLSHLADNLSDRGWGPAELRFEGYEVFPVSGGGGRSISGDAVLFILVATGRADAARADLDPTVNIYAP